MIQYGFITTLAANPSNTVIGLVRNKQAAVASLQADGIQNVHIVEADIVDSAALKLAATQVNEIVGESGLDVLICNAAYVSSSTALTSLRD